jgi:hypothetical protein
MLNRQHKARAFDRDGGDGIWPKPFPATHRTPTPGLSPDLSRRARGAFLSVLCPSVCPIKELLVARAILSLRTPTVWLGSMRQI